MIIHCIENNKSGDISRLSWSYEESDNVKNENYNDWKNTSKEEFISKAKENKLEDKIRTINTRVSIISDEYLRSYGDDNENNDLLDVVECIQLKYQMIKKNSLKY